MLSDPKQFPEEKPRFAVPDKLLRRVSNCLRMGHYDDPFLFDDAIRGLRKFSQQTRARKKNLNASESVYYLWSLCLQAELHDYQGRPAFARDVLQHDGPALEKKLKEDKLGTAEPGRISKRLLRQQLWTLVFWSHCHYRDLNYSATRLLLKNIRARTNQWLPLDAATKQDEPSYGLRARIAYSLGQVYRQESDVAKAREEFMLAIEFTRKRLDEKSKKYLRDQRMIVQEQRYASYVIAKAYSFGLSWASYNSGELHRARCSAAGGCTLLEATRDPLHQAYAQAVYAGILSAKARPVRRGESMEPELLEAVSMLRPLANTQSSPLRKVGRLLARARYTLAHALYSAGEFDEAELLARKIYEAEAEGSPWRIECGVVLVRLLLERKNVEEACERSEQLVKLIQPRRNLPRDVQISVLLCHADALMHNDASYSEIHKVLDKAGELAARNPLSMALWHLYRARCFSRQGKSEAAHEQLAKWQTLKANIENGSVLALADDVKHEIAGRTGQLTLDPVLLQQPNGFHEAENTFREWVLRRLHAQYPTEPPNNQQCKLILGIGKRQLANWMYQLGFNPWNSDRSAP